MGSIKHTENDVSVLIKNILNYAPGVIVPAVIALVSSAVFTRILDTADYGQYSIATSLIGLTTVVSSQWLEHGINRYLPGEIRPDEIADLKGAAVYAVIIVLLIVTVLSVILGGVLAWTGQIGAWGALFLPSALIVLVGIALTPSAVALQAQMQARRYAAYQISYNALRFVLSLVLVAGVLKSASGLLWGSVVVGVVMIPFQWRDAGLRPLSRFTSRLGTYTPGIKRFAVYGFPMIGWSLAATVLNASDRWVIQQSRGSAEVGIYSANYILITGAIGLVSAPIMLAAHPFLMRAWGRGDREESSHWLGKIIEWLSSAGLILTSATIVFSRDLAQLFLGPSFQTGHYVMPIVLAGLVLWQMGLYLHKPLEFVGQTRTMLVLCLAAGLCNVILNLVFVPHFGYAAAAYTTLASCGFYAGLAGIYGNRILPWRTDWRNVLVVLCKCAVGTLLSLAIRRFVDGLFGHMASLAVAVLIQTLTAMIAVAPYVMEWRRQQAEMFVADRH